MPDRCPICGESNACGALAAAQPMDCWCFHIEIPRALLERIPDKERGKSCVCRACAETFEKTKQN